LEFSAAALRGPGGPLSPEALARLQSHPRFHEAMRAAAGALVAFKRKRPLVVSDLGRLIIGNLALYLHFSRDPADPRSGLSVNRMKMICVEQDVCSTGRALAAVALMRLSGHLVPASSRADRRLRVLVPTERLITVCRQYWLANISAMTLVAPERCGAVAAFRHTDVLAAFMRTFGGYFRAGIRMFQLGEDLTPFAQRNAGFALMFSLLLAGEPDLTGSAPAPVRISVADLARRFAVSRAQVLRLLDDAVAAGLIERSGADRQHITVLPRLSDAGRNLFAVIFALCDHYLHTAMNEVGAL
jgi:DNA-binding MarR family transcriptional regulator